jgi:hypothetical protein
MPTCTSVVDGAIVPVDVLPPATPLTSQVTVVFVVVEEFERFTVATKLVVVLTGAVAVAGVMEIEVILVAPPPPHAASVKSEGTTTAKAKQSWAFRSIR